MFTRFILIALTTTMVMGLATMNPARAAKRILSVDDETFLHDLSARLIASAKLAPGQTGQYRNATPYTLRVPGGNMGYPAFWIRDSAMMLGGDFIGADELEGWIRLTCSTLRGPEDWTVRPGVVVPAFAVPDHINFDGKPTFYPGNYETGAAQGGQAFGKYPPVDDHFYFLQMVYEQWKLSGNTTLLKSTVKTSFNEMPLADLCRRVYAVAPIDPATGLCIAGDVATENAKDFGFCDAESKSGKLLFTSVLKLVAARQMAEMFTAMGDAKAASSFDADAALLKKSIAPTFFQPAPDAGEGWLHSATSVGNQPDVWGSAYAVVCGAVDDHTADEVSRALVHVYRDKSAVREGCVRHLLTTDKTNHGSWEISTSLPGDYQNGGYWGTATGWYIIAMNRVDHQAATDMARDYLQFLKGHLREDGMSQAWEWFNPDTGRNANPLYVATVALPYLSLRQAGLIRHE